MEPVAGKTQLGEVGLKFQGAEERAEGGGPQAESTNGGRGAPVLNLTQPGHSIVFICREIKRRRIPG